MKNLIYIIFLLSLLSCGQIKQKGTEEKVPVKVGVMTISSVQSQSHKVYIGEVDASSSTVVSANHIGVLESINVKAGKTVKRGDLLAEIRSKNVETSYELSHATLKQAEDGYARVKKVHQTGTVPDVKLVEIETQLAKARAAAKASEESLEECRIKAPFAGTVSDILTEEGVQVSPGTPIIKIVDISTVVVNIPVPEGEIGKLKVGQDAFIEIPALEMEGIKAKVISKGITAKFPSHTYECLVAPDESYPQILPGMVCKVKVPDMYTLNSIIIPASSVEVDMDGKYVWTVKDGKVVKTYVTVAGYRDRGVVISSGLEQGDSVIIQGAAKVSTGMSVQAIEQSI